LGVGLTLPCITPLLFQNPKGQAMARKWTEEPKEKSTPKASLSCLLHPSHIHTLL
jgi:hypothetical protein